MKFLKSDSIPVWAHIVLWFSAFFGSIPVGGKLVGVVSQLINNKPIIIRNMPFFVVSASVLLVLLIFWRSYWFLANDFKKIILSKGGSLRKVRKNFVEDDRFKEKLEIFPSKDRQRYAKMQYRMSKFDFTTKLLGAKIGDLFIWVKLNHYFFPNALDWDWEEDEPIHIAHNGRGPIGYMTAGSAVNIFCLGDFSSFPPITLEIKSDTLPDTGIIVLDQALQGGLEILKDVFPVIDENLKESLASLREEDSFVTLEIRDEWLRVKVKGGTWLGGKFGRRISGALEFTEQLVKSLTPHVNLYDSDKWTIDFVGYEYRLRQIEPSEQTSTG